MDSRSRSLIHDVHKEVYMDFKIRLPSSTENWPEFLEGSLLAFGRMDIFQKPTITPDVAKVDEILLNKMVELGVLESGSEFNSKMTMKFTECAKLNGAENQSEETFLCGSAFLLIWWMYDDIVDNLEAYYCPDLKVQKSDDADRGRNHILLYNTLQNYHNILKGIFKDEYGRDYTEVNYPVLTEIPALSKLMKAFKYLHYLFYKTILNYESKCHYLVKYLEKFLEYFNLTLWESLVDKKFSLESARYVRRLSCGFGFWLELHCLLRGIEISRRIRKDLFYKRLMMVGADCIQGTNDVLGVRKDLAENVRDDGLVMFLHLEKGISLLEAFNQCWNHLNEQAKDFKGLVGILRKKYPQELDEGVIDAIIRIRDGCMLWGSKSKRYGGNTTFSFRQGTPM